MSQLTALVINVLITFTLEFIDHVGNSRLLTTICTVKPVLKGHLWEKEKVAL